MRVVLLRPPRYLWPFNSETSAFWQPLGLLCLAAEVRRRWARAMRQWFTRRDKIQGFLVPTMLALAAFVFPVGRVPQEMYAAGILLGAIAITVAAVVTAVSSLGWVVWRIRKARFA